MIIVPPTASQASPAAHELGEKIAMVIREYRQSHPGLPTVDIHAALRIARLSAGVGPNPRLVILLAVGLLLLGGFLAFSLSSRPDGGAETFPFEYVLVTVFLLLILGIIVIARR